MTPRKMGWTFKYRSIIWHIFVVPNFAISNFACSQFSPPRYTENGRCCLEGVAHFICLFAARHGLRWGIPVNAAVHLQLGTHRVSHVPTQDSGWMP